MVLEQSSDGGGSTNLLPLLALIALVIPIGMVLIVVVVLVALFLRRKLAGPINGRSIINFNERDTVL